MRVTERKVSWLERRHRWGEINRLSIMRVMSDGRLEFKENRCGAAAAASSQQTLNLKLHGMLTLINFIIIVHESGQDLFQNPKVWHSLKVMILCLLLYILF